MVDEHKDRCNSIRVIFKHKNMYKYFTFMLNKYMSIYDWLQIHCKWTTPVYQIGAWELPPGLTNDEVAYSVIDHEHRGEFGSEKKKIN